MNRLFTLTNGVWIRGRDYPTYHEAILAGQEICPVGFNIDTGDRVPTREEQLLLPPLFSETKKTKTKRQLILEDL